MKIPNFIKDNKRLIIAAVRGAFDSEGTIQIGSKHHITPRRIVIASNSKKWLSDLKCILSRVNIESRIRADGRLYRLYITHQNNLKSFHKIIAPLHPKRKEKLKMLLETFSTTRIPERSMRKRILDAIKKGKTKRREIAHELKFPQQNLSWHLKWLKRNSMIKVTDRIYTNNGGCYIYGITKKGEKYLTNKFGAL